MGANLAMFVFNWFASCFCGGTLAFLMVVGNPSPMLIIVLATLAVLNLAAAAFWAWKATH